MNRVMHHNRWLFWGIFLAIAITLLLFGYIEFTKGEIDLEAASLLLR